MQIDNFMNKIKHILFLCIFIFIVSSIFSQKKEAVFVDMQMINSSQDDYLPFLIDENLFFTSNRRNVLEGQTLEYSEKVYFSSKTDDDWTEAKKNGYKWNSDNNTALIGVTDSSYYFYRSYWKDNGEIFTAFRKEDPEKPWKASRIKKLKNICTDDFDECSLTFIGEDSVLFVSNRSGSYDIFLQVGKDKPVAMDVLNSEFDENDVFYCMQTKTLYFSSNRNGGIGGWDIYQSELSDNQFAEPTIIPDTMINTPFNDRDFRWYNDSTKYFSSDRPNGVGGLDIYELKINKTLDSIPPKKIIIPKKDTIIPSVFVDTEKQKVDTLIQQLAKNDLLPFRGEVQFGAFRYIKSVEAFKTRFPCMRNENIRMDMLVVDGIKIYKFILDTVYTDVDEALKKRKQVMDENCLPDKLMSDMPFIGMLDKEGNRFAIFWEKDEFVNEKVFYLFKNGKQVWKGRRF